MRSGGEWRVLFVANGRAGSAAATRAERFAAALSPHSCRILLRESASRLDVVRLVHKARASEPDLIYCVDLAAVPLGVALLSHPRTPMIVDTGDHPSAFLRQVAARPTHVAAARVMEEVAYRHSAGMVVRGAHHAAVVRGHGVEEIRVIPDGVDLDQVKPVDDPLLRARFGLRDVMTVGIAGAFTWYDRIGGGLGWELVHALSLLPDLPLHGVLLGDGPGLGHLRDLAAELGVSERLHILGSVPYVEYGRYLSLMDVCLLTQTNDPSSWIRTTGKLPGYLAAGRYILASAVGTAADVLPPEMQVPYRGSWDADYPGRLADRLRALAEDRERLAVGGSLRHLAEAYSYDRVARQGADFVVEIIDRTR